MSKLLSRCVLACLLFVALVSASICSWVLFRIHKGATAAALKADRPRKRQRSHARRRNNDVLCPCVFGRFTTVQFTMAATMATVACFTSSCIFLSVALTLVVFSADPNQWPKAATTVEVLANSLLAVGYVLMCVTHFERLRLTFRHTSHQLPKWFPKVLYALVSEIIVLFVAMMTFYIEGQSLATAVCLFGIVATYFTSAAALICAFFRKTLAVASASERRDKELTHTAVRVTVSATLSVASTTVVYLLWAAAFMIWPRSLVRAVVCNPLPICDMAFNAFCLMCTFRHAQATYQRVLGRVHMWLMASIIVKATPELNLVEIASNTELK